MTSLIGASPIGREPVDLSEQPADPESSSSKHLSVKYTVSTGTFEELQDLKQ